MKEAKKLAMKPVYNAQEAAEALNVSRRTICRRCGDGCFQGAYREGLRWRIPEDAIESYLSAKQKEVKENGCEEK